MWVKQVDLCKIFSISRSTVLNMVNSGVFVDGIHYKTFPFGVRYNTLEIEKLNKPDNHIDLFVDELLQL